MRLWPSSPPVQLVRKSRPSGSVADLFRTTEERRPGTVRPAAARSAMSSRRTMDVHRRLIPLHHIGSSQGVTWVMKLPQFAKNKRDRLGIYSVPSQTLPCSSDTAAE